ncbi:unnamed protein product [Rotaria sp. Silwood2]|nr:unnamed protein product [Rotaria sp. Silwood2]
MSSKLHQFDEFQLPESLNITSTVLDDYLTYDFKLSDSILNNILSDFDVNTNDIQCIDSSINDINYFHTSPDLPSSYKTTLNSEAINNNVQSLQAEFDEVLSPDPFKLLIEQYQKQQTNNELLFSPPSCIPTDHRESASANMSNYQADQIIATREQTTTCSQSPLSSVPFPKLIEKPEPIIITFDQFQTLIRAIPNTSKTSANTISTLFENSTIIANNIPLRIVHQTSHNHTSNSSDKFSHQDSLTENHNNNNESIIGNGNGNDNRPRRNLSHTAIEKRYRSSINEKINELKEIVAITDGKIQKSGILRRTIEHIRQLQSTNRRLEEENSTLKNILKQLKLTSTDISRNDDIQSPNRNSSTKTPTSSSSIFNSDSNGEIYKPVKKRKKPTNSKRGMVDGSRLVLCCFMLCILITNPFNYLLDRIHSSSNGGTTDTQSILSSRTLQAVKDDENFNSLLFLSISWKQLIAWMLNIAICLVCLVKIFVHGEPIVHELDMNEYYAYKKKADALMDENQLNEAHIYYRKCCEKLYISIDNTYIYYLSSITWQIIRFFLNIIFVGRWLTYWSGWTKSIDTLISCISNDKQNINNITSTDLLRQTNSSNKTIYHMAQSIKLVNERYIMIIETIHLILLILTDYDDETNSTRILLLEQLGQSSQLLTSSKVETCYTNNNEDNLDMVDGILSLRLRLLTSSMTNNNQKVPFLDDFQRELDYYRRLNQLMKLPKQRLYLFESIFRTSSGLNPLMTQTLFECAMKQSNFMIQTKQESLPNLDIIAALLIFCHFLPSTVYRYRNILQQAVAISSKTSRNNDLNRLQQQCLTLIRQPYFTL